MNNPLERAYILVSDFHGVEFSGYHNRQVRRVERYISFLENEEFEIVDSGKNKQWGWSQERNKKYKFCLHIGGTHADRHNNSQIYLWLCVKLNPSEKGI